MGNVKLIGYTTNVSAEKSISEIEKLLAQFGADKIMKDFLSDGHVSGIAFQFNGKGFKLPNNEQGVFNILFPSGRKSSRVDATKSRQERAYRVSWRILKEWIHAQLSLVASGQAEPEQVLLPYMWNGKESLYDRIKRTGFQLEAPKHNQLKETSGEENE